MTRSVRVLHLIETLGSGGAERLLYTNLRHLDGELVKSRVVTVFSGRDFWKAPIEALGIPVTSLDCKSYRDIPSGIMRLRRDLQDSPVDVIHTHLFAANVIGRLAAARSNVSVVSSIHNPEYEPEAVAAVGRFGSLKIGAARRIDAATARLGCDRMIAVSDLVRQSAVKRLGYPADRIDVLYNPVDSPTVSPDDRKSLLDKLGLPENARVLLTIGRIAPQKGTLVAVRAMRSILEVHPTAHLLLAGSQSNVEYTSSVVTEVAALGVDDSVHLLGERNDIPDLLAACDVFLFPSLFEGLGIALAEAMAAGRACVAGDIRPFDEFIQQGINGILVKPADPESLAEAVIELLSDNEKRDRLGAAAQRTASDMFRAEPAARKLEGIYIAVARS